METRASSKKRQNVQKVKLSFKRKLEAIPESSVTKTMKTNHSKNEHELKEEHYSVKNTASSQSPCYVKNVNDEPYSLNKNIERNGNEGIENKLNQQDTESTINAKESCLHSNNGVKSDVKSLINPEKQENGDDGNFIKGHADKMQESTVADPNASNTLASHIFGKNDVDQLFKKGNKLSISIKKKKFNTRLSRLLTPKSAINFLNEFKPGCTYSIKTDRDSNGIQFVADVEHEGKILGTGKGSSKSLCKTSTAENAVKSLIVEMMNKKNCNTENNNEMDVAVSDDANLDLPWAGLASYAIYKLFKDWQKEGTDIVIPRVASKKKPSEIVKDSSKLEKPKELPPNAQDLHPTSLLNLMRPGILAVELSRDHGLHSRVVMGYEIEGNMFVGEATNKKDARKKAAQAAVSALWGVTYSS